MQGETIVITGASGLLGSTLVRTWAGRYPLVAVSRTSPIRWAGVETLRTDLLDPSLLCERIAAMRPSLVVHAAAWTDVDACEADPERAMALNARASQSLAQASFQAGAAFVYVSTDGVFDGERGEYLESDLPHPLNVYAVSKLAGEQMALSAHPQALILRVPLEGWRPAGRPGFIQWVEEGLRRGERVTVCTDWIRSCVFAANLPGVLEEVWRRDLQGIYHVAPDTAASNYEMARWTAEIFGLDPANLVPISGDGLTLKARRPKNTSLNPAKLQAVIGNGIWTIRQGIAAMRGERDSGCLAQLRSLVGAT